MTQLLYWHFEGSTQVHGPVRDVTAVAHATYRPFDSRAVFIRAPIARSLWNIAIFDTVDELFDAGNDNPATEDDPPSCTWKPEHLHDLRGRLEMVFADWLDQCGYGRRPEFADIAWHVALTAEELARIVRPVTAAEIIAINTVAQKAGGDLKAD